MTEQTNNQPVELDVAHNRRALVGFFVSGLLISFLGAILPAWHPSSDYRFVTVGYYFLSLNLGMLAAVRAAHALLPRKGIRFATVAGALLACVAFLGLAAVPPAWPVIWRDVGVFFIGASAGLLNTSIFHALSPLYKHDPASTVNLGGILLGLGCVTTALLVAGTFYVYTVPSILIFVAVIPGLFAIYCSRGHFAPVERAAERPIGEVLRDFKDPVAVLFSLLLFCQFGNEWSLAGWLAIFLMHEMGLSAQAALLLLAVYWGALLVGRIVAQVALERVSHMRLLAISALSALFGCLMLSYAPTKIGAAIGVFLVGGGFASIYPIVVERIGHRFTYYHPGFYNGIFSFAITGGLLAPWTLGYLAGWRGIKAVMIVPTLGTCMVVILVVLISLQARLGGERRKAGD
jgi:FHS family glucose/mannose:H+ symporter-like MFS transporter